MSRSARSPLILAILDGWGIREEEDHNAVALAATPCMDRLLQRYPSTTLLASEQSVGLPDGQMGNSEVGHISIGAGRVVEMDITRIDRALEDGSFFHNVTLREAMHAARGRRLHLAGLLSDGGVHSHLRHLEGLLEMARRHGLADVAIHVFLDGRDSPPSSGVEYLRELRAGIEPDPGIRIASVCGRYYAMDRDHRWERTRKAYRGMVGGDGARNPDPVRAVEDAYSRGATDEFVEPIRVVDGQGKPLAAVRDQDVLIFFNFRADRMRQLASAFALADFDAFERAPFPRCKAYGLTTYDDRFELPAIFPPRRFPQTLAQVLARRGFRTLRIAETEKYAHVTYFFNGGEETPLPGETRIMIPSPAISTYDRAPEMSARQVTARLVQELERRSFEVGILNLANADMVGHTGKLGPTIQAVETVDQCLSDLVERTLRQGGTLLITADHGNAEQMYDYRRRESHTAHTTNPVPLILVRAGYAGSLRRKGTLQDIAPTVLELLKIEAPPEMTGESLLQLGVPAGEPGS